MHLEKNPSTGKVLEIFGPTVEFLISPDDERSDFCVIRGTIPSGVSVPLHSHDDTEDFLIISGEMEGLRQDELGYEWVTARAGDYIHIPANARHAWRNVSTEPAISLLITTKRMGRFFQETGQPAMDTPMPVTPEALARFAAICEKYGHWNASPEENAAVGIHMSF